LISLKLRVLAFVSVVCDIVGLNEGGGQEEMITPKAGKGSSWEGNG